MSKRLSKIARELNIGISVIVEFLNTNGYDFDENPNEIIQGDVESFLKNNISAYLVDKKKSYPILTAQAVNNNLASKIGEIPLELKIIAAASKEKKLIERIIGFTDFDWHYTIAKFEGTCSHPIDFTLFDEVLCDLLLVEPMSTIKIGNILGLDLKTDPAEKEILLSAISELRKSKMIDTDGKIYWLTDVGKDYAKNGVKFLTFSKKFDLYIDSIGNVKEKAREIFSNLRSEKQTTFKRENLPLNIEEVKPLAELQAPEIHYPKNNFLLQSCNPIGVEGYVAKVWIVLLENFRDNTIRSLVYDENQDQIIKSLSKAFDKLEDQKIVLLKKLTKVGDEEEFHVEFTNEEKRKEQLSIENELIQKQDEIETAIKTKDFDKVKEIEKQVSTIKRHFNSLEFEIELKRLFEETADELWIISPWIKKNATMRRIPFFEAYLKKGGRIFIAYSEPEKPTDLMADVDTLNRLKELEEKYQNFYLHQLPKFHYKRVWLRRDSEPNLYYTGSYNILSFFVHQGLQNIRQEEMTKLDWDEEKENAYKDIVLKFCQKYLDISSDLLKLTCKNVSKIDRSFLNKLRSIDYGKLKPLLNRGINGFDETYKKLQECKNNNLTIFQELYFKNQINNFKNELLGLSKQIKSIHQKREIWNKFISLKNEFPEYSTLEETKEVENEIRKLKISDSNSIESKRKIKNSKKSN